MKIRKIANICLKKYCKEKNVDLLLVGEGKKNHYLKVLIKDIDAFMYDYTVHQGKNILSSLFTSF